MLGAKFSCQVHVSLSWSCDQYQKKKLNSQLLGFLVSPCSLSHYDEVIWSTAAEADSNVEVQTVGALALV